jgi:menaquinone-specific isochorismate synthase
MSRSNSGFVSLKIELPSIDFDLLLTGIKEEHIAYFKNREDSEEFLAIGVTKTFELNAFSRIKDLTQKNPELTFYGGLRFDKSKIKGEEWSSFPDEYFFLPKLEIKRVDKKFFALYHLRSSNDQSLITRTINKIFEKKLSNKDQFNFSDVRLQPNPKKWDEIIQSALTNIKNSDLNKVVLARKKILSNNTPMTPTNVLMALKQENQNNKNPSFTYLLQLSKTSGLISFSSERLFSLDKQKVIIDSMAGTRPRGHTIVEDSKLEKELLSSSKELQEHRVVTKNIIDRMNDICTKIDITEKEKVLKLKHVQHIFSHIEGTVHKEVTTQDIIETLHPTPAVGGHPWNKAKDFINNWEPFDRGYYASPLGYISKNRCDFIVGIRSALVHYNTLHLYAGAGIVSGSIGEKEWMETENKMKNFQNIF